jgi:hypothetical protein
MLSDVLLVGLASGVVSLTLARGRIFDPLRTHLTGWRAELGSCYLCLGAWVSGALTILSGSGGWLEWLASWAVSTLLAASVDRLAGT